MIFRPNPRAGCCSAVKNQGQWPKRTWEFRFLPLVGRGLHLSETFNKLVGTKIADRYCITGTIGKGGMGVVFRAIPFDDPSHEVAVKVILRNRRLGSEDLLRFQKEAALMSQLHHPNIICFHELGLFEGDGDEGLGSGYYIVMEIANGSNLKDSLARDGRKDLPFFFQVGLQVSQALDYTHCKNIIHRDIKPHNIIVGKAWRDQRGVLVKVLDFGVASLAEAMQYSGREQSSKKGFEDFAGTPLYMAPEQTGLLDAPADHRVDLYSLGCVLYEILAGRPPFSANSREKLEKQHTSAVPEPLTNVRPDVPPIVDLIVQKLLAKHPNDRYQTAFALQADLLRAKSMFDLQARRMSSFPLGLKDRFQAVSAQLQLVGRERELGEITEGYDAVAKASGRSRMTVIRGGSGIGKTRLMAEFRSQLMRKRIKFVSGNFSRHENTLPFNALANAFNEYLLRVLKSQTNEAEELRRKFKTMLGPTAHQVARVVPGLKPFLTDIPDQDVEVRFDEEGFSTFAKVFSDFTRCLATENQPVVFMFDDLHWADDLSLELIDQFFTNANTQKFYMIVGQRTGSHLHTVRFQQFLEKFSKLKRRFHEIDLDPINRESIRKVAGNVLSSAESVKDDLVLYLDQVSRGNPMHLVETIRTLVSMDLISPQKDTTLWEYDIARIRETQLTMTSVDLVLSRIQDYQESDRNVVEIAATVGLSFQFELLMLQSKSQSVATMKSLQRALDEGLITRVSDEPELRHLGKTFMFTHKKARDSIYENIDPDRRRGLHRAIGERLVESVPAPSEKLIFALAHHFNAASSQGNNTDRGLAEKTLKYNLLAGGVARSNQSWQSADKYFENAMALLDQWKEMGDAEERIRVQEALADLAAVQRRHGVAIKKYRSLLAHGVRSKAFGAIAKKTVHFQMVGGLMGETAKLIAQTLSQLGRVMPPHKGWEVFRAWLSLIPDVLPLAKNNLRIFKMMKAIYSRKSQDAAEVDRKTPVIQLYQANTLLLMQDNPEHALILHRYAMDEALQHRASANTMVRAVAERAGLLGYLGFTKAAYRYFDLAMDVARGLGLRGAYGYVALMRVLTLDYLKARHDEIADNLSDAMEYLPREEDRLSFGLAVLFRVFRDLQRCSFTSMYRSCHKMPELLPTRNWLTPRTNAMMLYGYLMQGSRDNIVRFGETYLKRRREVSGRKDDLFIALIECMIVFARGEIDKTRKAYISAVRRFTDGRHGFLFPFETDFVGIFAFTFPMVFEEEYGRQLMRDAEMKSILIKLNRRFEGVRESNRTIPLLLRARASELLGSENVRPMFDAALRSAKVAGNNLAQCLGYLWFGTHLIDGGQSQKRDYLRRAHLMAQKLELKALVDCAQKLMEQRKISLKDGAVGTGISGMKRLTDADTPQSRLVLDHLNHICETSESRTLLNEDLNESFAILRQYYQSTRIFCILNQPGEDRPRVITIAHPVGESGQPVSAPVQQADIDEVVKYTSPYFNIRSTLFLPLSDAPWIKAKRPGVADPSLSAASVTRPDQSPSIHETVDQVGDGNGGDPAAQALDHTVVIESASARLSKSDPVSQMSGLTMINSAGMAVPVSGALQISALIPIRSETENLGVVFVEDVGNLQNRDTTLCRHELDVFGAQLGLMTHRKIAIAPSLAGAVAVAEAGAEAGGAVEGETNAAFVSGAFNLEKSPWLHVWYNGKMRVQRESGWFFGRSFGPDHYVIAYCNLSGSEQLRHRVASMLWHHLLVVRAMAVASGRNDIEVEEIREEFSALLKSIPRANALDNVSLAFSVFDRSKRKVSSGHYGPARPFVLGSDNRVTPFNEVVMQLANGRDLRYWEVTAEVMVKHAYLLSYDTSKMDGLATDTFHRQIMGSLTQGDYNDRHKALQALIPSEQLPRYYLAAVLEDEENMPVHYDKAE